VLPALLFVLALPPGVPRASAEEFDAGRWSPAAEPALQAITRYLATDLEQWQYRRLNVYKGTVRVDLHAPRRPGAEHWQLISVDGREPMEDEREDYEDDRSDHSGEKRERLAGDYVAAMIVPGSVTLVRETMTHQVFEYDMRSPDGRFERVFEGLRGDLQLLRGAESPRAERVRVWNTKPVRPFPGLTFTRVLMDFRFGEQDGFVLPLGVDVEWQARALGIKEFGRSMHVRLTEFDRVAPPPDAEEERLGDVP